MHFLSRQIVQGFLLKNLALFAILATGISCSLNSEEISTDPSHKLRFSADTIFFDTIFTEIPSVTKRLRVYNDQSTAVNVASIALADPNTPYVVTINGIRGTSFEATKILANDSILVLLEADIMARDSLSPYVVEDQLIFNTNGNQQEVSVFSWGQDANYLKDAILPCNTIWTAGKPYVIYDHVLVDSLCTLIIEPGARIFSHLGSNIYVKGSIKVNGDADDRVLFMNDRFDGDFGLIPGQWGGITFLEGSQGNEIRYADIRNAEVGIWLGTPDDNDFADLIIENSIIENTTGPSMIVFTSDLEMTNCLLNNSGQFAFAGLAGGNYVITHTTIANYAFGFFKTEPSFIVSDQIELSDGSLLQAPISLQLNNNIIWGPSSDEIELLNDGGMVFTLDMTNNLFKTTNSSYSGFSNILNEDPLFINPELFDYRLDTLSPAINAGTDLGIAIDLLGSARSTPPDIGAYEKQ
jgi:hypothetical protein